MYIYFYTILSYTIYSFYTIIKIKGETMIDVAEELYKFNPWWEKSYQTSFIDRTKYRGFLSQNLDNKDIIIITGLRRVGKTSLIKIFIAKLLKSIAPHLIFYISLDSIALEKLSISEIIREYRKIHGLHLDERFYLFLDEVAYRKKSPLELKNLYDAENVKIFASSSSTSILRDNQALLTGRCRIQELLPLDFSEFLVFKNLEPTKAEKYLLESYFDQYMQMGGMPEYVLTNDISYLDNLINDIIYKDIIAYYRIRDISGIKDLFRLLMERAGKQISINKIAKIMGNAPDTIRRYIQYFLQTYLIYTIERYGKLNERIRSPMKLYSADIGIRNHLTGYRDKGAIFENLVFLKIKHKNPSYIYQKGLELDFFINKTLIEVKLNRELEGKQKILFEEFHAEKKLVIQTIEDYFRLEDILL